MTAAVADRPTRTASWWGIATLVTTEATVFAILIASSLFLRAGADAWPPPGVEDPKLHLALPFSFVLWGSSIPMVVAERAVRRGAMATVKAGMAIAWIMGAAFLAATLVDFHELRYGWRDHAYGSAFYTLVGLHAIHLAVGLGVSAVVQAKVWLGRIGPARHRTLTVGGIYWHFVDAVWLAVFPVAYLVPHLT